MMNSSADDFVDNPFRSSSNNNDVFVDASQQQQQQHQPVVDAFAPVSSSDPMGNMNTIAAGGGGGMMPPPAQMQHQQPMSAGAPAGLMSPPPQQQQQQYTQPPPVNQQFQQPNQQQQQQPTSMWGNLLLCLNLDSYKQYFNIDADDIVSRFRGVFLHFYKPEYFRNNVLGTQSMSDLKGPDLYGPFWITMTLIFLIGVTANMHHFLSHTTMGAEEEFDYDINHLLHAATICIGYSFFLPLLLWTTTYCCMSITSLQLVEWVCIYGYSMTPYIPAVVLCVIPIGLVSWILLGVATGVSVLLVVRNVAHPLLSSDVGQAKAPPILLVILGSAFIFLLFLKFSFYHYTPST
mmetsp:Transcript_42968/g.103877  ORF Transcript_42968/g.103877 Transcript_42968/m.103877 type:complete len:348 (-) Transcript_42968:2470-3513(-)|eukprot:CAMPEP_0113462348 /NCGR_PEP_ID=MMETSP0014_2-20120614/12039_1 /TAXON_ID=2857 /ORGANISM="Nitzschia sp." /LENGTH=347 /DNA_ID=CAMNT_0000354195 /DNA_START=180 /DNA_END=1223 /DNA_ORIENTATION=- /assembly_acc=CAM_ASM_000159